MILSCVLYDHHGRRGQSSARDFVADSKSDRPRSAGRSHRRADLIDRMDSRERPARTKGERLPSSLRGPADPGTTPAKKSFGRGGQVMVMEGDWSRSSPEV